MMGISITTAQAGQIAAIQEMQDKALADYGTESASAFFPRTARYRQEVLDQGGELYIATDPATGAIIGSMIGVNAASETDFVEGINAEVYAGGELLLPGVRKILSAAIVGKAYLGRNIWRSMMLLAAKTAHAQNIRDLSFASALSHAKICTRAIQMGFCVTGVARHRIMDIKGIILSAGAQYITRTGDVHFARYDTSNSIDVELETYLDGGFIGTGIDPVRQIISLLPIDEVAAMSSRRNIEELVS